MTKPYTKANFFLIGAPKAGTTSLDRLLRAHPDVYLSPIKEPFHFCYDINDQIRSEFELQKTINLSDYLANDCPDLVHHHLVEEADDYAQLYKNAPADTVVVGECTTSYLSSKVAAKAIHEYNPDSKIVAIIRDPITRIRSHYNMDRRTGSVQSEITVYLEEEIALGENANHYNSRNYMNYSRYLTQIENWQKEHGSDKIMVIIFEELIVRPNEVIPKLYKFLGINAPAHPSPFTKENSGAQQNRFSSFDRLLYVSRMKPPILKLVRKLLPRSGRDILKKIYFKAPKTIKPKTKETWLDFPEIKSLQDEYNKLTAQYGLKQKNSDAPPN